MFGPNKAKSNTNKKKQRIPTINDIVPKVNAYVIPSTQRQKLRI